MDCYATLAMTTVDGQITCIKLPCMFHFNISLFLTSLLLNCIEQEGRADTLDVEKRVRQ